MMFIFASIVFLISGLFTMINPDLRNIEGKQSGLSHSEKTVSQVSGSIS
jgi:hypothetical protein